LFLCLLCLWLSVCGSTSSAKSTTPASKPTTVASTGQQQIKVTVGDFYIHSPVTTFTTGTNYQFVVTNVGTHYHNFLIMHPMPTMKMTIVDMYEQALSFLFNVAPKETKTLSFTFNHTAPPGMLEFSCHYGGHYEVGMHQAIVVNAAPGASVSPYPNNAIPLSVNAQAAGPCNPAITTKIVNGAYTPARISLKSGDTLTVINTDGQSDIPFAPGARLIVGGPNNTKYLSFPYPGSFIVSSEKHPEAKATISVSKIAGTTCGMTPPVTTVIFNASYIDPKGSYSFTPTQVTIKKGQSIRLSNLADQNLTFISTPDADLDKVMIIRDWEEDLKFTADGIYTISCVQIPNQKFTVTVQGT
jgi:uncharacterized cupredoxin-like copper-binding protein